MLDLTTTWDRPCRNRTAPLRAERFLRVRLRPRLGGDGLVAHVALALDTSGSMEGSKLQEARQACLAAAELLRPQDRLSVIAFSTRVEEIVRDQPMSSVDLRDLAQRLGRLEAQGVTRTDMALQWLDGTLRAHQGARFAILATDGHPTDPRGNVLEDFDDLHSHAQRIGQSGINLSSIGLGDAENFNGTLLVDLVDRGRGRFLHARSAGDLTGMLREHFEQAQSVGAEALVVELTPQMPGLELQACCQIAPTFLPMDRPEPAEGAWRIRLNNVRGDIDTDLLFHLQLPAPGFAEPSGIRRVLTVVGTVPGRSIQARVETSIENVASLTEEQKLNKDVHDARVLWDVNVFQDAALHARTLTETGDYLQLLRKSAIQGGYSQVAQAAQEQLDQLAANGQIDPNASMRTSQIVRNQGGR